MVRSHCSTARQKACLEAQTQAQTWLLQSGPPKPSKQSHVPKLQTPWPEQKLRSEQESKGWMVLDRQVLQHCAGAMGTSPIAVILQAMVAGDESCQHELGECRARVALPDKLSLEHFDTRQPVVVARGRMTIGGLQCVALDRWLHGGQWLQKIVSR